MPRRRRKVAVSYPRDAATEARVREVAAKAIRRHDLERALQRWEPWMCRAEEPPAPMSTIALDDYSSIPFVKSVVGVEWYQYRARVRCGDGDCYAVAADEIDGYEEYNRSHLGLGRARMIRLARSAGGDLSLARRLTEDSDAFERLILAAGRASSLRLHPYMAIESVWELARRLGAATGRDMRVIGPPPEVTALVNDKARFSQVVEDLFGPDALARTSISSDPAELARLLGERLQRHASVALKMPSCASGMGNRIFPSAGLRGLPPEELRRLVDHFLEEKEWDGREPVLVVEWHRDVLESPSTQCWIPPLGGGEPQVEEVYQQLLTGNEQVFVGAVLSNLPRRLRHRFMIRSWLLCRVFQRLGYVGRCSFDALIVGTDLDTASVRFVECNGRWGGTSTPLHLMKRVFGDFRTIPYRGQGYVDGRLRGLRFRDLVAAFGSHLYDRRTGRGRVLLYNVGGVTEHGKFDMVVTGRSHADVERFISDRVPALIDRCIEA